MLVLSCWALSWGGSLGCEGNRTDTASAAGARDERDPRPVSLQGRTAPGPETRKKADPTPEIIEASKRLLVERADAPIGSEFPLTVGGQSYIGRIEEHDNPNNEPGRPSGKHKGVTVYER